MAKKRLILRRVKPSVITKKIKQAYKSIPLLKKKSQVSPHKKYKTFKRKVSPFSSISSLGDGLPKRRVIGFKCTRSCKLNFSTMIGIKKKSEILKRNIVVSFRKYPTILLTRKSTGHRMGKGKGKFSARIAKYKMGEIIFEISFFDFGVFDNYYRSIVKSFPVPVKAVINHGCFYKKISKSFEEVKNFKRPYRYSAKRRRAYKL